MRYWVIINPISGNRRSRLVKEHIAQRSDILIRYTDHAGHAVDIAREAAEQGIETLYAVGGDGTVRECTKGLMGSQTALAVIPAGSGNGVARSLNIPLDPDKALLLPQSGKVMEIDVAMADQEPFLLSCGFGFDARVTERFSRSRSRGLWNYVRLSTLEYFKFHSQPTQLQLEDETILDGRHYMCCVSNLKEFGNGFIISETSNPTDGLLEVVQVDRPWMISAPLLVWRFFSGKAGKSRLVNTWRTSRVSILSGQDIYQLDGESYSGDVSTISISPKKLRIWVPGSLGGVE